MLTERGKAGIRVVEAALSSVALPSELSVLKRCAAQRAGDVAREADLDLGQGLVVVLGTDDVGADTTARDHDRSRERVQNLAQGNLVGWLLSPLLELLPDTL